MKFNPHKLEGWGYRTVKLHNVNFNRFRMIHSCDGQTDGRRGDSIKRAKHIIMLCCRALKTDYRSLDYVVMSFIIDFIHRNTFDSNIKNNKQHTQTHTEKKKRSHSISNKVVLHV